MNCDEPRRRVPRCIGVPDLQSRSNASVQNSDHLPSDHDLVALINRGDDRAFDTLYARYRDWVAHRAVRCGAHGDEVLEVVQETFMYLARKVPELRLEARMTSFLHEVVRHCVMTIARRRRTALQPHLEPWANQDPLLSRDDLADALATLTHEHRETLLLRFADGLNLADISTRMQVPVGTVKSRLHHALRQLRGDPRARAALGA